MSATLATRCARIPALAGLRRIDNDLIAVPIWKQAGANDQFPTQAVLQFGPRPFSYTVESRQNAGIGLQAKNSAGHLDGRLADRPKKLEGQRR